MKWLCDLVWHFLYGLDCTQGSRGKVEGYVVGDVIIWCHSSTRTLYTLAQTVLQARLQWSYVYGFF